MRHSSFLEVNFGMMAENFKHIQLLAPKSEILPMVKANAYGNGMVPVSQFLVQDQGVKKLGCASLGEALYLIKECPELDVQIIIFSDVELIHPDNRKAYASHNIIPVIHHARDLDIILNDPELKSVPLYLKLNTGMNRLGLSSSEIEKFLPELKQRGIRHLMTHFARSSQLLAPNDKCHKQYEEFKKIKKYLLDSGVSIQDTSVSNSGAIEQSFGIEETTVRPGLMLYGPPSVTEKILWHGHQVSRFVTKILSTSIVKKGTPVGYGVNVCDKDSLMAIIPVGYGDGLISYGTGTKIIVNGCEGKIFGRINMDMAFIQFDPSDEGKIKIDTIVELWNHDNKIISEIAIQNKTIPYQLMCGVSNRIPRIYKIK